MSGVEGGEVGGRGAVAAVRVSVSVGVWKVCDASVTVADVEDGVYPDEREEEGDGDDDGDDEDDVDEAEEDVEENGEDIGDSKEDETAWLAAPFAWSEE